MKYAEFITRARMGGTARVKKSVKFARNDPKIMPRVPHRDHVVVDAKAVLFNSERPRARRGRVDLRRRGLFYSGMAAKLQTPLKISLQQTWTPRRAHHMAA